MNAALLAEFDEEIIGFRVWDVIVKAMQPFKNINVSHFPFENYLLSDPEKSTSARYAINTEVYIYYWHLENFLSCPLFDRGEMNKNCFFIGTL